MDLMNKLKILAESARYDVSCASSSVERKNNSNIGNSRKFGICHSWGTDGRCISLLKILMTNKCIYNCAYCVNNTKTTTKRVSLSSEDIAKITYEFYRRNYIEGLFLSSGIEYSPNRTMEKMYKAVYLLRNKYGFAGYIHAKAIPNSDPEYIIKLGKLVDRMSVNIELPTKKSLALLAPQKSFKSLVNPMNTIYKAKQLPELSNTKINNRSFIPGGQSTQIIVGASNDSDKSILLCSSNLYNKFKLKRVYYSAYVPVIKNNLLPSLFSTPPKLREHRLYQADWLMRFYGYKAEELLDDLNPNFDLNLDPKFNWALNNLNLFPIDIYKASYYELLRIPGIGPTSAKRIIESRRYSNLNSLSLKKMGVVMKRAKYFISIKKEPLYKQLLDSDYIKNSLFIKEKEVQLSFLGGN